MRRNRRPNGVSRYATSRGGFSPHTVRRTMPKRVILRHRSFITLAERPGHARRNALGRLWPSAQSWSRRTDHLHPTMLSTIAATGMGRLLLGSTIDHLPYRKVPS
jgi:hypothetical protein